MSDSGVVRNRPENNEATFGADAFTRPADTVGGLEFKGVPTSQSAAEQLAYQRGQQDMLKRITAPRMTGWRIACGICWAFWTLIFGISALMDLAHGGVGTFLLAGILTGLAGWYDYRIWTLKARRLTLFIIF
jgi:hypothetical protein